MFLLDWKRPFLRFLVSVSELTRFSLHFTPLGICFRLSVSQPVVLPVVKMINYGHN